MKPYSFTGQLNEYSGDANRLLPQEFRVDWNKLENLAVEKIKGDLNRHYELEGYGIPENFNQRLEFEVERWKARNNLFYLSKNILGYDELSFCHSELCDWFVATIDERIRFICLPRGHFKTTIVSISATIWHILNDPGIRIGIYTGNSNLGNTVISPEIQKHFTENTKLIELFPEIFSRNRKDYDKFSNEYFCCKRPKSGRAGVTVNTLSEKKASTGFHYDKGTIDDAVHEDNYDTAESRAKTKKVLSFLRPKMDNQSNHWCQSVYTITGTIYHYDDWHWANVLKDLLPKDLLEKIHNSKNHEPVTTGKVIYWPIYHEYENNGKSSRIFIFPERFNPKSLDEIMADMDDPHTLSTQYLLQPVTEENKIFQDVFNLPRFSRLPSPLNKVCSIDFASSEKKAKGDKSVMRVVGIDPMANKYSIDSKNGNWEMEIFIKHVGDICIKNECHHVHAEKIGVFEKDFEKKFHAYMSSKGYQCTFQWCNRSGNKSKSKTEFCRIALQGDINKKKWYFNRSENDEILLHQLDEFPNGRHDDEVDTLAIANDSEFFYPPEGNIENDPEEKKRIEEFGLPDYDPEESRRPYQPKYVYTSAYTPIRIVRD
jgi:phage terminase large subunit-like protein